MAENVGSIYYQVDADTSGLLRAERDVDRSTERMERSFDDSTKATQRQERSLHKLKPVTRAVRDESERLGGALDGVKKFAGLAAAALATIGVTTGIRNAIDQIGQFQSAMNGLAAVSGATEDQLKQLEMQARSLGATSQFSAQQAAEAQRFLAQAGFEVNEILSATPGLLQLATAGSLDLASAADIASNVLGGMRMEVSELGRVNDVLAATAAGANTSIEQLGVALSYAAPFAAGAGLSIEDAAAAIGVMSDAGIQGSRAGTGLIGVIRQLSRVTSTGERALSKYGLSMSDVDITTRGLMPVIEDLRAANLSTADAIEIFGSEAGAAAQVLISDYKGAIEGADGSAARMAGQLERGLIPAMKSLQSAMAESILQLGDSGLAGGLENIIRVVTGVISVWNGMGDTWAEANGVGENTMSVIRGVANAIQIMAAMAAGRAVQSLGAMVIAKAGATASTITLTGALTGMRAVLMTLFGPVGLVVGAAATLYTFRKELGLVGQEATNTARRINQLTQSISQMSATEITKNLESARMEMRFLSDQGQNLRRVLERMNPGDTWDGRTYEELQEQLRRVRDDAIGARNGVRELESALERATTPAEGVKIEMEELEDTIRAVGESTQATGTQTDDFARKLQSLLDTLYPMQAQYNQFIGNQNILTQALAEGRITLDEYRDAWDRLEQSMRNTGEVWDTYDLFSGDVAEADKSHWEEWLSSAEEAFTDFDQLNANLAENFTSNFGNMFADVLTQQSSFKDGFQGLMQGLVRSVVAGIGEMIAQWLAYKAVTATLGFGLFGGGGLLGGFAGLFDKGGRIPSGQWGVAGENGPEIINGPANITSTAETARIIGRSADDYNPASPRAARQSQSAPSQASVYVNVHNAPQGTEVVERQTDGRQFIDVFIADVSSNGRSAKALQSTFGLQRQGR